MNARWCQPLAGSAEQAHVRELLRAWASFMEAAESDAGLRSRTRISAGAAAAALQKVAADVDRMAREWRELRLCADELQLELRTLQRRLHDLSRLLEDREEAAARP